VAGGRHMMYDELSILSGGAARVIRGPRRRMCLEPWTAAVSGRAVPPSGTLRPEVCETRAVMMIFLLLLHFNSKDYRS